MNNVYIRFDYFYIVLNERGIVLYKRIYNYDELII